MLKDRLRAIRTEKGMSQAAVAKLLSISRQAYNFYETGRSKPDPETLDKLAGFFGVTVDYLLGRDELPKEEVKEVHLNEKDLKKIKEESNRLRGLMMTSIGMAFDGEIEDEDTLDKVMKALEEGMMLAKKEAKEKYTPKKYKK